MRRRRRLEEAYRIVSGALEEVESLADAALSISNGYNLLTRIRAIAHEALRKTPHDPRNV